MRKIILSLSARLDAAAGSAFARPFAVPHKIRQTIHMAEEKEDKEEDFAEQRRDGASHLEKDRRQEHPRNIQTCSLFLEEMLVPNAEPRYTNINDSPELPAFLGRDEGRVSERGRGKDRVLLVEGRGGGGRP